MEEKRDSTHNPFLGMDVSDSPSGNKGAPTSTSDDILSTFTDAITTFANATGLAGSSSKISATDPQPSASSSDDAIIVYDKSKSSQSKPVDETTSKDRYGFYVNDDFHKSLSITPQEMEARRIKEAERAEKWMRMIKKGFPFLYKYRKAKLKRRVRKGIPDTIRSVAWYNLSGAEGFRSKLPPIANIDTDSLTERVVDEIERDVDRTFPRHFLFQEKDGIGQRSLRRILQMYAVIDPEVGYCQGMGFIAGLMLTYLVEEEAFLCFVAALQRPDSPLRLMYLPNMAQAQKSLYIFGALGKQHLGELWQHLEKEGMHPTMYATEWLMTMYCRGFSFDLVTRVWDIFFHEGYKIVYRVALALIKNIQNDLMAASFEKIMEILRNLPAAVDASHLMENVVWKIPLTHAQIESHGKEYDRLKSLGKIMY